MFGLFGVALRVVTGKSDNLGGVLTAAASAAALTPGLTLPASAAISPALGALLNNHLRAFQPASAGAA